jgi:SAM-dependent methyltransferase
MASTARPRSTRSVQRGTGVTAHLGPCPPVRSPSSPRSPRRGRETCRSTRLPGRSAPPAQTPQRMRGRSSRRRTTRTRSHAALDAKPHRCATQCAPDLHPHSSQPPCRSNSAISSSPWAVAALMCAASSVISSANRSRSFIPLPTNAVRTYVRTTHGWSPRRLRKRLEFCPAGPVRSVRHWLPRAATSSHLAARSEGQIRSGQVSAVTERATREAAAYDEDHVWEKSHSWHVRVKHVLEGANTRRADRLFDELLTTKAAGGRVLDVGCGPGRTTRYAIDAGATYALGIEISRTALEAASKLAQPGRLEFRHADVQQPLDGRFDLIFGRSVLHHIDFRGALPRWYHDNLLSGGRLLFMEPASHPMTLAFHLLVPSAHTPDEFTLLPRDIAWIRRQFPQVSVFPVNLFSFPAGVMSSLLMASPDNALMRIADRIDRPLQTRRRLSAFGRQVIIAIEKPTA